MLREFSFTIIFTDGTVAHKRVEMNNENNIHFDLERVITEFRGNKSIEKIVINKIK